MGVHIGMVCLVDKVEPQRVAGIFFTAGQGRVLENMGQARVVDRPCREGQLERAVGILVGDIEKLRAGFLVLKQHQLGADDGIGPDFLHLEALHHVAHGGQGGGLFLRESGNQPGRQRQAQNQSKQFSHG